MIPIPIPGVGGGGGKALGAVGEAAKGIWEDINLLVFASKYFLLFISVGLIIFIGIKLFDKFYYRDRFRKILILLHRLYTELFLLKNISRIKETKKLDVELSYKESISELSKLIRGKFFIKKAGEHNSKRIIDGLKMIKDQGADIEVEIALVENWIELVQSLLC
jgi:hypothetical protein